MEGEAPVELVFIIRVRRGSAGASPSRPRERLDFLLGLPTPGELKCHWAAYPTTEADARRRPYQYREIRPQITIVEADMVRTLFVLVVGALLGVAGMTLADKAAPAKGKVTVISAQDVGEKLDGKAAKATVVEVALEPGEAGAPHRHPGPVFGYVLEGTYELGIDDKPARKLKVGDTFYEPTGCLHRVSRNPSKTGKTRVLAVVLHPRDAKQLAIPEAPAKDK
jgi:quercetin dioxygenase-like cupin family protein